MMDRHESDVHELERRFEHLDVRAELPSNLAKVLADTDTLLAESHQLVSLRVGENQAVVALVAFLELHQPAFGLLELRDQLLLPFPGRRARPAA